MKKYIFIIFLVLFLVLGFFALNSYIYNEKQATTANFYTQAEFVVEGERISIGDEYRFFGNQLYTDLDTDGDEDVVFLIIHTQSSGNIRYYAVASLHTDNGYIGSDGYFLGENIAPQSINVSPNPRHVDVIVVNYGITESFEVASVSKSAYLKIVPERFQWAIVEPDFPGEAR